MRMLIVTPDFGMAGGVAAFHRMLRDHMTSDLEYFIVGSRRRNESFWRSVCRCLWDAVRFYRAVREWKPDVVILNPSLRGKALPRDGLLLLIAKGLGTKVVVFFHGWDSRCERFIRERCLRLFRAVFFRADALVVLGALFRNRLMEMGYGGPIYVATTAVEDSFITDCDHRARSPEDGGGKPFRVLFLTRIEKAKGIYEALDTYRMVKRDNPQTVLTVAGDGNELATVRRYVRDRQIRDVAFTGYLKGEAKRRVFLASDCYLFPSYSEGMPLSVLEAMACGLPVVTHAVGGLRDFFESERMGFMTESQLPEVYARYIGRLARDAELCRQMGRFNRAYAKEHFSASKVAVRFEDICRDVLAGRVPVEGKTTASTAGLSTAGRAV